MLAIFFKGETQIKVELALLWRDYVKIEYHATAAWPGDNSKYKISFINTLLKIFQTFLLVIFYIFHENEMNASKYIYH